MAKKIKVKIEIDKQISKLTKDLSIIRKSFNIGGTIHPIFDNIPSELKLDVDVERGRRVLTAYYPDTHDIYFIKYYCIGEPSFPHGGVRVYNRTLDEYKIFYPDAVVKHKNIEFYTKNLE